MFELSVAWKYLVPRWRQLSVSIISLISVLVISLVVWLILVFFSVANGLEHMWVEKMIAMTAPVRVTPTPAYYDSYYYQVDGISDLSGYALKSINEKAQSDVVDPYSEEYDQEIPDFWPMADRYEDGSLKDLVKEVFYSIDELPGVRAAPYEMTFSNLRLQLGRDQESVEPSYLNQSIYLGSYDPYNPSLDRSLLALGNHDYSNLLRAIFSSEQETGPQLEEYFHLVEISELSTPEQGWVLAESVKPKSGTFDAVALMGMGGIQRIIIPQHSDEIALLSNRYQNRGISHKVGKLEVNSNRSTMHYGDEVKVEVNRSPIMLTGGIHMAAQLDRSRYKSARTYEELPFEVELDVQGQSWTGRTPLSQLQLERIAPIVNDEISPLWVHRSEPGVNLLPRHKFLGEPVLLPRSYREGGALLGDKGHLSYYTAGTTSVQEQRVPIYVAGFYDQGISPIGGKFVMVDSDVTSTIRATYNQNDGMPTTGIHVRFADLSKADAVKAHLKQSLNEKGIDAYWNVETYKEYEFTKDLIQQLKSEKLLFSLIAGVIIIVACSNIISMLIILVNDKRGEIGILKSMGASSVSIAAIFGICGMMMGLLASIIGIALAIMTLHHLDALIGFISYLQGHDMFNAVFYGDSLPNQLSGEALTFVLFATALTSLIAGVVPAVKACLLKPSEILRSE